MQKQYQDSLESHVRLNSRLLLLSPKADTHITHPTDRHRLSRVELDGWLHNEIVYTSVKLYFQQRRSQNFFFFFFGGGRYKRFYLGVYNFNTHCGKSSVTSVLLHINFTWSDIPSSLRP